MSTNIIEALTAVEKLIASKKRVFKAGEIVFKNIDIKPSTLHLHMVLHNRSIEASERAAESQGFAAKWGGRLVHQWVRKWVTSRELPVSSHGSHGKVYSLLDDPAICAELRSYLRSNKWSMDPTKLAKFVKAESIPTATEKYICHLKYMELELFPHIQYCKVGKGITLETAHHEHALKKKGVGWGIHVSGVICATKGYLNDAEQTMEYGKNYEGYWTGELFVKQLHEKIIPAFEKARGPGYQALIIISSYSEDALLVSQMNLHPGGKQAHIHNGWFIHNGEKIDQPMMYPPNHPEFPNQLKGLQENLPNAMRAVALGTVWKWEHQMYQWMDAYQGGLSARDAQFKVKAFSSRKYTSHQ
ncbi:hypothetical protein BU17DRAFT_74918 [Hysterangium stoloniferum]|nr:hypothetical protein BU17DRAFT_74918 [Hysterangium stoloniferum]